jgi:large subunit ribosomal protein L32e
MTEQGTNDTAKALKVRARVKRRKPAFVRPESWRYMRLKENWRRPRGLDHKIRRKIKGWPAAVSTGYQGPKVARGLHPSGYREVLVYNTEDLMNVDPKTQAIRIAHTVGRRKRARIIVEARKKKMTILNLKEAREVVEEEKKAAEEKKAEEKAETEEGTEAEEEAEATKEKPKQERAKKSRSRKEKQ